MNRYKLRHITEFRYDGPVSESYNEVRLQPRHDDAQSCISFRITTEPSSRPVARLDFFNNWVHVFHVLAEHTQLRVEAESVVLVHPPPPRPNPSFPLDALAGMRDELEDQYYDWMTPTGYTPHLPELRELIGAAENRSGGLALDYAEAANILIHERFRYQKGATHVHSSLTDCLDSYSGVCQDFAHLLLAMLRDKGLPGRYVSGYLVPRDAAERGSTDVIGGQASHAWVEVLIPGGEWVGLDPTNGVRAGRQHIRVAYGRDYGDVAPVRGVYKGHAGQTLSVDVLVRPELDTEGSELLQNTSAAPPSPPPEQAQQQQQ